MSRYTIGIDGIAYHVEILEDAGSEARVVVNDREFTVSVEAGDTPLGALAPPARPPVQHRAVSGELRAPIPSRVTEVLVSPGDRVEERQLLLKLEAMKMENHVLSPIAGTVEKVCVAAGQEVAENELLVEIAAG
jgi:biotin carboxyl carrier protein